MLEARIEVGRPRVSVVVPCYNAERYVGQTLQSLVDQTYRDFEVIVVDDGSTDGSREVVEGFRDARIRTICRENGGPAAARNTGIAAARGEFIATLDADDLALPHRLAAQLAAIEADPGLSVLSSGYTWIDQDGQAIPWEHHSWQRYPELNNIRDWLFDCPFVPSATMFRRSAWEDVGGFDEELIGPEDWNFWMRLVLKGHRLAWHRDVVCLYRHRSDGVSHDAQRMTANCAKTLTGIMAHPEFPPELLEAGRQGLALRYVDGTKRLYLSGLWDEGKEALRKAIDLHPDLLAGEPCRIEDELLNVTMDPLTRQPRAFLRQVLSHLPENAGHLLSRGEQMLARCDLELFVRGLRERDWLTVLRQAWPVARALSRRLSVRSTWALFKRAAHSRLKAAKDRILPPRPAAPGTADRR
ncbi:MAG TPA: glycosyltransferase [Anaerolineae bacterium]|nr:glycosyltransferase [Anaerolineae bacterium]